MKKLGLLSLIVLLTSCSFFSVQKQSNEVVNKNIEDEIVFDISDPKVMYLEIDTSNVKKVYEVNEPFDSTNLIVYKHLDNDTRIECFDYSLSNVDTSTPGISNAVVRCDNFFASFEVITKGYIYHNYDEKYVYYINETFNKNLFSLIKYDEDGEHIITDYDVSFPDNTQVGLGKLEISYEEFYYSLDIAIMKKQDNVPLIFSANSNSKLMSFTNNIHQSTYKGNNCTVSEGYYLLVKEDGSLELYDYTYMLLQPMNASYFSSSNFNVIQRLIPGGDLLVSIYDEIFIVDDYNWHHTVIGW